MRSPPPPLPARVGPCELNMLGAMVAVRCPQEFADIILRAGGLWEPGSRRWLVERRRIGPVIRARSSGRPTRCSGTLACRSTRVGQIWTVRMRMMLPRWRCRATGTPEIGLSAATQCFRLGATR